MNNLAGAEAELSFRPGATFASFRLVARVSAGKASEVWLAKIMGAEGFEKVIALKTMRAQAARSPEAMRTFTGEAAIAARLYHPNIVQLVDFGHVGDRYFMAMEFVNGMTLGQMAARMRDLGQAISPRLLVHIGLEICAALHYVHELDEDGIPGFLHRDLEPQNVMITRAGAVKIIDFGAARPPGAPGAKQPFTGHRGHAAPEVLRGQAQDRRCDVYSLGTILHGLVIGAPAAGDRLHLVSRLIDGQIRAGRPPVADVPEALLAIIRKAMAPRPSDRYATAEEMARALQAFVATVPVPRDRTQSVDAILRSLFLGLPINAGREAEPAAATPAPAPASPRERFAPESPMSDDEQTRPMTINPDVPPFIAADDLVVEMETVPGPAAPPPAPPEAAPPRTPDWFSEPRASEPEPASDIFRAAWRPRDSSAEGVHRTGANVFGTATPPATKRPGADFFAIRRGGAADAVSQWTQPTSQPAAPPPAVSAPTSTPAPERTPPRPRDDTGTEAARCFDRGLAYISERQYALALDEWQRADALAPGNRLYQNNLRRLQAQIDARNAAQPTEAR